ncbi:CaiB/BaiF CoA transferase family protein [Bosea rubneri]|uniref:CoA transferase n=1 Tax=Bosea rubneri TaxID=3075434 RepID=A0ABU3S6X2_9HYPH|nr:CoA transferase [Bosea sp. ZW T0_25]MDU0340554.1 CoA transferase [Bosea sp. ZW T0_25]
MSALDHLTVLDFSHLLAGPLATQMMGDLGADIIKVERVGEGDLYRRLPPFFNTRINGESPHFLAWNRNKRSLALDLKSAEARDIILEMAAKVDVVVENFRPGVMERLGLGYEQLAAVNPAIIYCSSSGYGASGPMSARPGQDLLLQGISGFMSVTGSKDGRPTPLGISLADQLCSYHIVYAVLAALIHRMKTGRGQRIEVDMLRACLAHQGQELLFALTLGKSFERPASGIAHPGMPAPFGVYRTADGWMTISMNPVDRLADVLDLPALASCSDERLWNERDEVHALIEAKTATASTAHWVESLLAAGLWAGEINSLQDVASLEQAEHLGAFASYEHPTAGTVRTVNIPVDLSETPGEIRRPAPRVGEHSREVLAAFGFDDDAVAAWIEAGIVGDLEGHASRT